MEYLMSALPLALQVSWGSSPSSKGIVGPECSTWNTLSSCKQRKTIKKRSNECSCFIFQYVAFALGEGILEKKVGHFQLRAVPFFIPSLIRRVLTVLLKFVCTFCAIKNKCSWRYIWRFPENCPFGWKSWCWVFILRVFWNTILIFSPRMTLVLRKLFHRDYHFLFLISKAISPQFWTYI